MAKGRMINTTVRDDAAFNGLSQDAALLYLMAIPHLDRDGLLDGRPVLLWATVAPLRSSLQDRTPAIIHEWVDRGLVIRYNGDAEPVLFFHGFRKNQSSGFRYEKEAASRFPPPPGYYRGERGLERMEDGPGTDQVRTKVGQGRREDQDQLEDQDQDQSDDDRLRRLISGLIDQVGWTNTDTVVSGLDDRQLLDLATWLWYARMAKRATGSAYAVDHDQRIVAERYADHPFANRKIDNPFMYAVRSVQNGNAFPLHQEDRAAMIAWMEQQ